MIPAARVPEPQLRGPRFGARRWRHGPIAKLRAMLGAFFERVRLSFWPWLRSVWSGRGLRHQTGASRRVGRLGVVAVVPYYGSDGLLRSFLDHHRRFGVEEFVFLDLSSAGQLSALLAGERDCAVWRPRGEPAPRRADHWLNYLRRRYATGRWCLSIELNEFFVFPSCETRHIADLTEFLEGERRTHLFALLVDMYGEEPAETLSMRADGHPLDALPYFDTLGYVTSGPHRYRNVIVRGGVRRRALYADAPRRSPALNRVPLVKWRRHYVYVAGTRLLMPPHLNNPHSRWHSSPTACLLSFALIESDEGLARASLADAGQILRGGGRGAHASFLELRRRRLKDDISQRFTGSEALVACGLLNPGQWF